MTTAGKRGDKVRADAWVSVSDAARASYELRSSVEAMYGDAIRRQIEETLSGFGDPKVHLEVEDSGALPFAFQARLEAAICAHLDLPLPEIQPKSFEASRDRPRRTRLYLPGDEPKLFPNAPLYGADMLVLDLEDSVASENKFAARAMVRRALQTLDWGGCERVLRIDTVDDIAAVVPLGVQTLLLPKVEHAEYVHEVAARLDDLDVPTLIVPLIESANGVIESYSIVRASERVVAVTVGIEDYVADIGAERSEDGAESAFALGQIVNAARAAGVTPLASVYPNSEDMEATAVYARRMKGLGFEGIGCIHPRQVLPVHRTFAPSDDEVERARTIVEAYEAAINAGKGAVAVGGRMVDLPVYRRARRILDGSVA